MSNSNEGQKTDILNADTTETPVPAGDSGATRFQVPRISDDEARQRIRDILLDAALKSGTAVDEDELDAATSSIFDAMKKSFS